MFKDEQYNNISTEGIGFNVGYISKSTFTNYFKQFTNQTPASYRKEVNPKRSE
jgi:transcriptional regulator GlxA family with amidase domain